MDILVCIPDDLALRLGTPGEVERRALEALALEEYRLGHLTAPELQRLLAFATGRTLGGFLQHDVPESAGGSDAIPSRRSVPVIDEERRARAREAAANIIARRKGVTLGGLSLRDLIDEG
jgi:hypothetical protein